MTTPEIISLLSNLSYHHFENQEEILRSFKRIANVPQSGDEYVKNKNVWELQDAAIERLQEEKQQVQTFLNKIQTGQWVIKKHL